MSKYRFKNKSLENALVVLYGEDFVEDQVNRQMANNTSFICFELDEDNGFFSSTTISKGEIAEIKEYKPNFWNPFPDVLPPASGNYLVYVSGTPKDHISVDEYVKTDFNEFWRNYFKYQVLAFRALNVEPPEPEESCE